MGAFVLRTIGVDDELIRGDGADAIGDALVVAAAAEVAILGDVFAL
jgi:hypothetical protein